jgi:cytochrome c biogenesis protein CcmG, thiol:disulfide interchange protein DsbE
MTTSFHRTALSRAILLLGLLSACGDGSGELRLGEPVPEFAARSLDGDSVALSELRGEVVLLNIWATWCPPCREEMPAIESLHQELSPRGLRVVAVSIDRAGAEPAIRRFADEFGLTFDILHDAEQQAPRAFRTIGVPETLLIDREGRLVHRWIGQIDPNLPMVREPVEAALASG